MLSTPLGNIIISADGKPLDYRAIPFSLNRPPVSEHPITGCFRIHVTAKDFCTISCILDHNNPAIQNSGDSGEKYLNAEFIFENFILHIGREDENAAFESVRLPNGLEYRLLSQVDEVVFGIAWTDDYHKYDVRTWFAADPTIPFIKEIAYEP